MIDDAAAVNALLDRQADVTLQVPGTARVLAADDLGDPVGTPIVLLHGTPDSRLARHPDPSITRSLGVRLVAVDRPGFGHSTVDPDASPTGYSRDIVALLDHLDLSSAHVLAWSAGAIWALGAAAGAPDRVRSVTAVGGLVPFEAFADQAVRDVAGEARLGMIETAEELGASAAAEMIAPLLVPDPITPQAALEHRREIGDASISAIPGADVHMAAAICDAVRNGTVGLIRDVTVQLAPSGVDLGAVSVPTRFVTGVDDTTCPPAFAHWFAAQIPGATTEIVPDAGHGLLLTYWHDILARIVGD